MLKEPYRRLRPEADMRTLTIIPTYNERENLPHIERLPVGYERSCVEELADLSQRRVA
jgi:hypothetical protein